MNVTQQPPYPAYSSSRSGVDHRQIPSTSPLVPPAVTTTPFSSAALAYQQTYYNQHFSESHLQSRGLPAPPPHQTYHLHSDEEVDAKQNSYWPSTYYSGGDVASDDEHNWHHNMNETIASPSAASASSATSSYMYPPSATYTSASSSKTLATSQQQQQNHHHHHRQKQHQTSASHHQSETSSISGADMISMLHSNNR